MEKQKKNFVKFLGIGIVVVFFFFYFLEQSGYYEYNLGRKMNLTEDAIKRFEEDVAMGRDVDVTNYLNEGNIDYSNNVTRTFSNISLKVNDCLKDILTNGFGIFDDLFR